MLQQNLLLNLINSSELLSDKQKNDWQKVIINLRQREIENIAMIIEESPDNLKFLTENIQSKLRAFQSGNKQEFDKILKNELKYLDTI